MDPQASSEESIDPVDEQLLALLDGDLDDQQREALERRLIDEPTLRKRLRELQRSWEILNEIPPKTVDHRFASTTVEVIVKRATQELEALPLAPSAGARGKWTLVAACALMFCVGIAGIFAYQHLQYRKQLADLAIADHLDALQSLRIEQEDLAFLQSLAENKMWQAHIQKGQEQGKFASDAEVRVSSVALMERPAALNAMSDNERKRLESNWQDWKLLTVENQNLFRTRYELLLKQADGDALVEVADQYAAWLKQFSAGAANEIASEEPSRRIKRMQREMAEIEKRWLDKEAEKELREMLTVILDRIQRNPDKIKEDTDIEGWLARARVSGFYDDAQKAANDPSIFRYILRRLELAWTFRNPHVKDEFLKKLIESVLTPEEREKLQKFDPDGMRGRFPLLFMEMARNDGNKLHERYNELDPAKRERIDLGPPYTFRREVYSNSMENRGPPNGRRDPRSDFGPDGMRGPPPPPRLQ